MSVGKYGLGSDRCKLSVLGVRAGSARLSLLNKRPLRFVSELRPPSPQRSHVVIRCFARRLSFPSLSTLNA